MLSNRSQFSRYLFKSRYSLFMTIPLTGKQPEPKMAFRIQGLVPSTPASSGGYQQPNWNARAAPKPVFPRLVHGPYFNLYEEYLKYFLPEPEKSGTSQQSKEKSFSIFTDPSIENSVNRQQTQLAITEFFIGTTVELWLGQNDPNVNNMVSELECCDHYGQGKNKSRMLTITLRLYV